MVYFSRFIEREVNHMKKVTIISFLIIAALTMFSMEPDPNSSNNNGGWTQKYVSCSKVCYVEVFPDGSVGVASSTGRKWECDSGDNSSCTLKVCDAFCGLD
jgi:hypothetical protein